MVFQERTYGVLIVSVSNKFIEASRALLPPTDYYPVETARSAGEARRALLEGGAAPQVLDGGSLSEDPSPYTLMDINVTLTNRGMFPAEWLHITAVGAPGDIAVYAITGEGSDVAPRDSATVNLKLVTTAPADAPRSILIQYYVHGVKREITVRER